MSDRNFSNDTVLILVSFIRQIYNAYFFRQNLQTFVQFLIPQFKTQILTYFLYETHRWRYI